MRTMKAIVIVAMLMPCSALFAAQTSENERSVAVTLPPKVKTLLIQEMNALRGATEKILSALIMGQSEIVAVNAQAIHDSFILKQQMTEEDKRALLKAVPEGFVTRDKAFHQLSARLAQAAREKDGAQQVRLFNEMVDACIACHRNYAADRFPGLSIEKGTAK